ncbi:unnamed protein product [Closterium sp. Naga37s-1]|nr:unnamed protein product [Closterium sp. Naga37s-1]
MDTLRVSTPTALSSLVLSPLRAPSLVSPNLGAVSGFPPRLCVSAAIHHSDSNRAPFSEPSALSHRHASSPLSVPLPPRTICQAAKRPITRRHVATKDAVDGGSASGGGGGSGEESDEDEEVATLVRGMTFAELCDDFECVSSPAVERTAKQLARDIHDMREDKRTLSCFAIDSKYSDSIRSFTGRDKYRRLSWIRSALQNSSVVTTRLSPFSPSSFLFPSSSPPSLHRPPVSPPPPLPPFPPALSPPPPTSVLLTPAPCQHMRGMGMPMESTSTPPS